MNIIKSGFCVVALAVISQSVMAVPFAYEARSLAMGNVGVATADIATAPFTNPAMLSFQKEDDDFSLLLGVGGFFSDNDDMIGDIEQFQLAYDDFNAATAAFDAPGVTAALANMQIIATQLDGKFISPELSVALAMGITGDTYSMAVSARSDIIIAGGVSNISVPGDDVTDPAFNILTIVGASSTEVGFSISRAFEFLGRKVSIGVTPKTVSVEAIGFSENIITSSTDVDTFVNTTVQDLGSFTTLDAGLVIGLTDNIQIGVVAKNLIANEMNFLTSSGTAVLLSFDTQLKAGVAYSNEFLTIGADLDLTENASVLSGGVFTGLQKKNMSVGMEVDVFDFVQLRLGMIKNMASGVSDANKEAITTVGLGLWLGFNLDVAVVSGAGVSTGVFVQTGFNF